MINQDRMIFADFSVNSEPIAFKFCKGNCQVPIAVKRSLSYIYFKS